MASGQVVSKLFPANAEFYSALFDTRNNRPVLIFSGAAIQEAVFTDVMSSYAGGGVTVDTWWMLTSATSGTFTVQTAFERFDSALDGDTDSFAAFQSAVGTAPGTAGQRVLVSIPFTHGAQMDGLLDAEPYRFKIQRPADGISAELVAIIIRET